MKKHCLVFALMQLPTFAFAANFIMDSRTQGIAGAGTASASFLSSGFYNPALAAFGHEGNRFGVLFPTLGIRFRDSDQLIDNLEDFSGVFSNYSNNPASVSTQSSTLQALQNLQTKNAIVAGGMAGSAGIFTPNISGVFFINAFTEGVALSEIDQSDLTAIASGTLTTPNSKARVLGAGIIDIGLVLAGKAHFFDASIALGITPKIQQIYTYHQEVSVTDFDISDWTDISNRSEKSTMNIDIGIAWQKNALQIGLVGKNILKKEVATITRTRNYLYELNPLFTFGTAWKKDRYLLSADMDLNKQKRIRANTGSTINDDTQLFRLGGEYNLTKRVQLRAGFIYDVEENWDETLSLGVGVIIDELARVDTAFELIDKNSYGASIQLSFSL